MRALTIGISLFAVSLFAATAAEAGWQDVASQYDQKRLMMLQESRAEGLQQAQAGRDMGAINEVLGPQGRPIENLSGMWRCRQMKLGGMTPSRVYDWFNCRISDRGGHLYFQKLNGSTRTAGYLYPNGDGTYVYLGAVSVVGEPVHAYSGSGASVGEGSTPDDQIGLLVGLGGGHARIELPYPMQESTFDVIELKRSEALLRP
ncbi:MAG TPA: DUF4893 domain-containing protein [Rhizomicrobium sp.]|nr:DUF4893 domain-containing protein [Rhizomicrobium sp.]